MFDKRSDIIRFLTVADSGGIGMAADRLEMTQPALTRVIARLEREFDGRLFERLPKGVRLTSLGATAAEVGRRILSEIEAAEEQLDATQSGRTGTFRITAGPVWTSAVLPEVIGKFHMSFPRIELKVETTSRAEGLRRLARGYSDLHCGGMDDGERLPDFLRREHCVDLTAGIVAHRDHPLLSRSITFDDLAQCPWIDFDAPIMSPLDPVRCSLANIFEQMHERTSARVRTIVRTSSASLFLMANGPYLSWLSLAFLDRLNGLSLRPLPVSFGRFHYRSGFVVRRSAEDLPPFRAFEAILRRALLDRSG